MSIPTIPGQFLIGNLRDFNADTLRFLREARQYGDLVRFHFGPFEAFIANSPEAIHDVLVSQAAKVQKTQTLKRAMNEVVGQGLFTSDGEFWKRQRKLSQPAFHSKRIANYADIMVEYAQRTADSWHDGDVLDVDHEMADVTMRIVSKALFDAELSGDTEDLGEAVTITLGIVDQRFRRLLSLPSWLPTAENRRLQKALVRLDEIIQTFVDERRRTGEDKGDLLSMLLMAQTEDGSSMTDKQLRDESMTLFGAGHETTANALTWTWYLLSQHPEVEAKLHAELESVLGGRVPTFADLPNLPYTEMVVKESMRLYPPAWTTSRQTIDEVTINGHTIAAGKVILVNIWGVHRDPAFFEKPERFDPERFSVEREAEIPKYAYLPFGGGPRVCIGNAFAMMEARLILATLAQRFHLSLAPGHEVEPARFLTLRPKHGMRMVARARETVHA